MDLTLTLTIHQYNEMDLTLTLTLMIHRYNEMGIVVEVYSLVEAYVMPICGEGIPIAKC